MSLNPRIRDWSGLRVWLLGASSGIGLATASALHARGARVIVSARNQAALQHFASRHPGSEVLALDSTRREAVKLAADGLLAQGPLDLVAYFVGHYQPMRSTEMDLDEMLRHQSINYTGALYLLAAVLPALVEGARQGRPGHLSLVSSVAGYRGLPKSLAYGPTKAALIHLAETLYLDLHALGLGISVVNPGFVATPLTAGNDFHMPALISPEEAAEAILAGWSRGEFDIHFPKRFTRVMKLLQWLPYSLYFPAIHRVTGL